MPLPLLAGLGILGAIGGATTGAVARKDIDLIQGVGPNEASRNAGRQAWEAYQRANQPPTGVPYIDPAQRDAQNEARYGHTDLGVYGSGGGWSGGGGGGAASNRATAAQLAEYDQAIGQLEHGMGRLDPQLAVALSNISSQYGTRANELDSSFNRGKSNYGTQTTQNQQQRRGNVNVIDDQSASGLRGLTRRLGSMGAVGSDLTLAGRAVQDQANQMRAGAGQTFAQNQQGLDTNWGNFQKDIESERKKAADWKSQQENSARAQSESTRQSLLNQLAGLRGQRASAQGLNGANAARADLNAANALSSQIDQLGRISPTYTGQRVDYKPQSLDSYQVGSNTVVGATNSGLPGTDPQLNIYNTRNNEDDERRQRNQYL